jgi:hypothetical protein
MENMPNPHLVSPMNVGPHAAPANIGPMNVPPMNVAPVHVAPMPVHVHKTLVENVSLGYPHYHCHPIRPVFTGAGVILVLFILLVIISRGALPLLRR